jgi:hypothetical protein
MFNFPFVDDAPQYRADTLALFAKIKEGKFIPYTSEYVVGELNNTSDEKRKDQMLQLLTDCQATLLKPSAEIERLAALYVAEGIIPATYETDALHIATAAVNQLDCIISLNFKHIVKDKTIEMTEIVNYRAGYKKVGIYIPAEVIYGE